MVIDTTHRTGVGLYTASEAAKFARVHPQAITRWIHGSKSHQPVVDAQIPRDDGDPLFTFLDLIQALAIRAVRTQANKISLQSLRKAVRLAKDEHGLEYPLATRHLLYHFDGTIVLKIPEKDITIGLSGNDRNQQFLKPITEPFLQEITFNDRLLAEKWSIPVLGEYSVVLSPTIRFGQPTVMPVNILASSLFDAVLTEGSVEYAAQAYEIESQAVAAATKYFDLLTGIAA